MRKTIVVKSEASVGQTLVVIYGTENSNTTYSDAQAFAFRDWRAAEVKTTTFYKGGYVPLLCANHETANVHRRPNGGKPAVTSAISTEAKNRLGISTFSC